MLPFPRQRRNSDPGHSGLHVSSADAPVIYSQVNRPRIDSDPLHSGLRPRISSADAPVIYSQIHRPRIDTCIPAPLPTHAVQPAGSSSAFGMGLEDAQAHRACALFDGDRALVKTVKNADWLSLVASLRGKPFRTSTSLPPPHGMGMRLFGEVTKGCAGLVWDRAAIDLSDAFAWPSGYQAKTEFNLTDGRLHNGRAEALVSLKQLVAYNASRTYVHPSTNQEITVPEGTTLPCNEVNFTCKGVQGVAAVFVRSLEARHLLFALGVVALLKHALGISLPLVLVDSSSPVRPVGRGAQSAVLHAMASDSPVVCPCDVLTPRLPLDLEPFQELTPKQAMLIHGAYGITAPCLAAHFRDITLANAALKAAVAARNIPSAREVVRASAPVMLHASQSAGTGIGSSPAVQWSVNEAHSLCKAVGHSSDEMLVALGALIALGEFYAGMTTLRLQNAINELKTWLAQSPSYVFLFQSWLETRRQDPESKLSSFMSGEAITNRRNFLDFLEVLESTTDGKSYVRHLLTQVSSLRQPCLRFSILRDVLGLGEQFTRDVLHGTVSLAFDIVSNPRQSPFGVDEATLLEAEAQGLLGGAAESLFASDPLGAKHRECRARHPDR